MTQQTDLNAPWSIHLYRDGTEDIAVIRDANGDDLVYSGPFKLPEGDNPIPTTLAALQLMAVAPKLLIAARATLTSLELILEVDDPSTYTHADLEAEPLAALRAAISEAEDAVRAV